MFDEGIPHTRSLNNRGFPMDEHKRQDQQAKEAELHRPEDAVKDLEPDEAQAQDVKGGGLFLKVDSTKQ